MVQPPSLKWKTLCAMLALCFPAVLLAAAGAQEIPRLAKRLPRPYEGAPPLIPHDAEARKGVCLSCHETGVGGAPIVPHPTRNHFCLQCHVGQDLAVKPFVAAPQKGK
jgi:nitrate reductase cytochrome c-type subunit